MTLALELPPWSAFRGSTKPGRIGSQAGEAGRDESTPRQRRPRLRTLVMLRWIAVAGQAAVLLSVHFGLGFDTPLFYGLLVIGVSAWLNVGLTLTRPMQALAGDREIVLQVGFDIIQASILVGLTGGMNNPFVILLIGPVAVGTAALPLRWALLVGALGLACVTALKYVHLPLPWSTPGGMDLPYVYEVGMWAATVVGMVFTAGYAYLASRESARMELALAATQHVLAREQRVSALGALAAAAAHELGTPLATIQITAAEMRRSLPPGDPVQEDAELLVSQAVRCRDILKRLSREPEAGDALAGHAALAQLLEEVAEPHRQVGPEITVSVRSTDGAPPPVAPRSPEIIHALSTLVENAVDFADGEVILLGSHDRDTITVEVADDGPGFAAAVLAKLGEPYVTTRSAGEGSRTGHTGMGLGFFIAKTLLERTGAAVNVRNGRRGGAVVCVCWPRAVLEGAPAQPTGRA